MKEETSEYVDVGRSRTELLRLFCMVNGFYDAMHGLKLIMRKKAESDFHVVGL